MSTVPQIGPRASLILGMLLGTPQTADEIHATLVRVNEDPDLMVGIREAGDEWGSELAIRTLAANPELVVDALERLRSLNMVDAIADPDNVMLWSARRMADAGS